MIFGITKGWQVSNDHRSPCEQNLTHLSKHLFLFWVSDSMFTLLPTLLNSFPFRSLVQPITQFSRLDMIFMIWYHPLCHFQCLSPKLFQQFSNLFLNFLLLLVTAFSTAAWISGLSLSCLKSFKASPWSTEEILAKYLGHDNLHSLTPVSLSSLPSCHTLTYILQKHPQLVSTYMYTHALTSWFLAFVSVPFFWSHYLE